MTSTASGPARAVSAASRAGARRPRRRSAAGGVNRRPGFLVYGLLLAVILGSAFPLYWSFLIGSYDATVVNKDLPPIWPGGHFFENAARVFDAVPFWVALGNSVFVSTVVACSVTFFSTLAGYAFAKLPFRGRTGAMVFIVATMAVPMQLGVIPLFIVMSRLGLTDSLWPIILPGLVNAFGVFFMRQYLVDAIPDELIEAARVDGCSMIRTFWHVALPAARPAAAILWLFTFMATWTDFFWPLIVLPADKPTVQLALQQLQSGYYVDYALVLAGVTLASLPLLALFVLAGRHLVSGIMQGAVKG